MRAIHGRKDKEYYRISEFDYLYLFDSHTESAGRRGRPRIRGVRRTEHRSEPRLQDRAFRAVRRTAPLSLS